MKIYVISGTLTILLILLVVSLFNGVHLGKITILSLQEIANKKEQITLSETNYDLENTKYQVALSKLNREKELFQTSKNKYEAISEETIRLINERNTQEKYSIEYIWIKLGNYAQECNLDIIVAEPGNPIEETSEEKESIFQIQVKGTYLNVASFIYDIENDSELKFKLDNIKMEYLSGNRIQAEFNVRDIAIVK